MSRVAARAREGHLVLTPGPLQLAQPPWLQRWPAPGLWPETCMYDDVVGDVLCKPLQSRAPKPEDSKEPGAQELQLRRRGQLITLVKPKRLIER